MPLDTPRHAPRLRAGTPRYRALQGFEVRRQVLDGGRAELRRLAVLVVGPVLHVESIDQRGGAAVVQEGSTPADATERGHLELGPRADVDSIVVREVLPDVAG